MSKPISVFEENESCVRSYCRKYPVVFEKAKGSYIYDGEGNGYLDFLKYYDEENPVDNQLEYAIDYLLR